MKIRALVLAVLTLCSILCGCQTNNPTQPATTAAPSGPAQYTVKVVDPLGQSVSNVGVKFYKNGENAGMAMTDANGVAVKELERGDYTVQLTFVDVENSYYYSEESTTLTATKTDTQIMVSYAMAEQASSLVAPTNPRASYTLTFETNDQGGSVTISGMYDHSADGTYSFTYGVDGLELDAEGIFIIRNLRDEYMFQCSVLNGLQPIEDANGEVVTSIENGTYTVMSTEYQAYDVVEGCTYVKLAEAGRNYFVFTPVRGGVYEFSVVGVGTIGSYGTVNYVYDISSEEVVDNRFSLTITPDMIGTNGTGTTQLVVGIDHDQAGAETYLCIKWVSDPPTTVEWENYASTYRPSKYNLPAGAILQDFDLTASTYTLVYNENDKFYHLNSADGPLVLIRLLPAEGYEGFVLGNVLLGSNLGSMHYDENGELVQKVLYNDCVQQYLGTISGSGASAKFVNGMCDDTQGVYPLTKDLAHIIKTYGEFMGYWDADNLNYMFGDVIGLNVENAWLFVCCYLQ